MYEATLLESYLCAPHTKHFRFRVEGGRPFWFQPGQHVSLVRSFNGEEQARPYSIASPPREDNSLEFCLNLIEPGLFSGYLFGLQAGERVRFDGPFGSFLLRPDPRDSLFVATGTGIAPIRSMLHHLFGGSACRRVWLLFGVRNEHGILYREEFEQLAGQHPNFRFVPTLSRPGEQWPGATGYVQEHIPHLLDGETRIYAYVCGLNAMVNEVSELLEQIGVARDSIIYEKYG